jgi:uncharacterized protein
MLKNKKPLFAAAFLLLLVAGLLSARVLRRSRSVEFDEQESGLAQTLLSLPDSSTHSFQIGDDTFSFEVVNTPISRGQGLSGREEIGSDGMLFVFPDRDRHAFWMKDMEFDLDLLWIVDEEVVEVTRSVSAPQTAAESRSLRIYQSDSPVNIVLEVEAGFVEEYGLEVGSRLVLDGES